MSGNHTPTPWVYVHESTEYGAGDDDVTFGYLMQEGDEQYQIAPMIVDTIDGRANAEFIVTAVNSYASSQAQIERLTKALADIAAATDPDDPESYRSDDREGCLDTVQAIARAALSGSKE